MEAGLTKMLDVTVALLLGPLGLAILLWIRHRRNLFSTFKRLNIPGPEPHFIFGNLKQYLQKGPIQAHKDWSEKYGKIFGVYTGARPTIVIGDAELLRRIQVRDFQNFMNVPCLVPGGLNTGKVFNMHLIKQRDENWRKMRAILSPSFTSGKLKQMVPTVNETLGDFLTEVERHSKSGKDFDIYSMYKALTLDIFGRTAFGIRTEVQKNPKTDKFLLAVQYALREDSLRGIVALILCLPEFIGILQAFRYIIQYIGGIIRKSPLVELAENCDAILKARRANPQSHRTDLLQLMLDAQMSQNDILDSSFETLTGGYENDVQETVVPSNEAVNVKTAKKKMYNLTDDEILSNTFLMLFGGFETTSTAMGFISHVLVKRQDIQDKIREEVTKVYQKDGYLDLTNVSRCKYLDQVFLESLRCYPPVVGFGVRECASEMIYGEVVIPKGVLVQVSTSIQSDPDYWTDPSTFDPERFAPENNKSFHQMAFQGFGGPGPRNCIGMRFAQMEARLTLANLLLRYRLVPGERTELGEIEVIFKVVVMNPKNGVFVKAEKLDKQA